MRFASTCSQAFGWLAFGCVGCAGAEKEASDPGAIIRDELVSRAATAPRSLNASRTVHCACDADGGLHVVAPPGSRVTTPESASDFAQAQIDLPGDPVDMSIRRTKSLGFIGDNPLTPSPSRGGPWNVGDALLPPHRHASPHYSGCGTPGFYGPRVIAPRWVNGYVGYGIRR
jgi:hypothetical protein